MKLLNSSFLLIGCVLLFGACDEANDVMESDSGQLVFVTSTAYSGDLGGLVGGDAKCQQRAIAGGHAGSFKAWLGDDSWSPAQRLTHSSRPYLRPDGVVVADNWDDLVDGLSWGAGIDVDEAGATRNSLVWTGAHADGSSATPNCENWTTGADAYRGRYGQTGNINYWTYDDLATPCDYAMRLYCFEQ